jgi:hypothetical protein
MINASQFNNADSYHQHCECYRIVIEPMPPLQYIHDTLPLFLGSHLSKSCYFCVSSCSTTAAICGGMGAARVSYWALRHCPIADSQTLLSQARTALL